MISAQDLLPSKLNMSNFSAKKLSVRPFSPTYPILACGLAGRSRPPSHSNTFQILLEEPKPLPGQRGYVFISSGLCLTGPPGTKTWPHLLHKVPQCPCSGRGTRAPRCPSYTQPPPSGSTFAMKDMGVGWIASNSRKLGQQTMFMPKDTDN